MEVVHCYVPLGWELSDRTLQLQEEYGIDCCDCARCEIERAMQEEEQPEVDALSGSAAKRQKTSKSDAVVANAQETQTETEEQTCHVAAEEEGEYEHISSCAEVGREHDEERSCWYVTSFLMRHICEKCGGTLAPPECSAGQVSRPESAARRSADSDGLAEGLHQDTRSIRETDKETLEQEEHVMLCCTVCDNTRTAQEEKEMFEQMMAAPDEGYDEEDTR